MLRRTDSLKRPDLKGNFPCRSCGQVFLHYASLHRHRQVKHHTNFTCLLCGFLSGADIGSHMQTEHNILKTFFCRCCGLVFDNKQDLCAHVSSVKTGVPRTWTAIARSNEEPSASTSTTTTSSASPSSTRAPTPPMEQPMMFKDVKWEELEPKKHSKPKKLLDVDESCDKLLNDAVERILKSGIYMSEQLVFPETWEQIVTTARATVMRNLERKVAAVKKRPAKIQLLSSQKPRPAKRVRTDRNE